MFKVSDKSKDSMPTTSLFVWFIPAFFIIAIFTKDDSFKSHSNASTIALLMEWL